MADRLTPRQRSELMSRSLSENTGIEKTLLAELKRRRLKFRRHVKALSGVPDQVLPLERLGACIDGDFWHAWRSPAWRSNLPAYWQDRILRNRTRDRRNFRALRRKGWRVLRLWEHQIGADLRLAVDQILALRARGGARKRPARARAS